MNPVYAVHPVTCTRDAELWTFGAWIDLVGELTRCSAPRES